MSDPKDLNELLKSLPQKALRQIRTLSKGNGANPDSIQIKHAEGRMIECQALTHIELDTDSEDESKRGQHQIGDVLENGQAVEQAVNTYLSDIIKKADTRKMLATIIQKSKGQGFGSHGEHFPLDSLKKDFCFHQPCGHCEARGQMTCRNCGGHTVERCTKCHGRKLMTCNYCQGSGTTTGPNNQQVPCRQCAGRQQIPCTLCGQTGTITCRNCGGSGHQKCSECDGAGIFTFIRHIQVKIRTLFEIDRTELPHPVVKVIEDTGPRVVERGYIQLKQAEQVQREDGGLAISYLAAFPYGDLELSINGKSINTHLFGFKGKMLKLPNFLESLVERNYDHLQKAAMHKNNALQNIKKAAKSRLIAQGLALSLQMPGKKAMMTLKKKFPMGVSNGFIQSVIKDGRRALSNVTHKTRMMGFAASGLALFVLYTGYLLSPIKTLIGNDMASMVIDIVLIIGGGFLGTQILGMMLKRPLLNALGKILPNNAKIKSYTQVDMLIMFGLSTALFAAAIILMPMLGKEMPSYIPF